MKLYLMAVGERMPAWINSGFDEYRKRLGAECGLQLIEIPPHKRTAGQPMEVALQKEAARLLQAIPRDSISIALDRLGKPWSTADLAKHFQGWLQSGQDVVLLIGGPEGLANEVLERVQLRWSLSALTFPHALVRVMVAEQLYRAYSILKNHPYHK
ncbi:MAG: 23S rRNA (pseudouridine(1915)-N(3))-methyltransferase RlmH [Gammaproteobacteria bacterium]|nr:23S rRNA (pseudouridine(1915)-N(3))-methyltransferase RlmH [Gammaproteobacteria bacterium]